MKSQATLVTLPPIVAAIVLMCACKAAPSRNAAEELSAPMLKPFTLYVCNQSLSISPIDILIEIDGKVVVQEEFEVGRQLNWKTFDLRLSPGNHTIRVSSDKGEALLSEEFFIDGEYGAAVQYWYYPESHRFATARHFRFSLLDDQAPAISSSP